MKINSFIKSFLIILFVLILLIVGILAYHDFFSTPKVIEKEMGPYTVATKKFIGSYYKVGPVMEEVDKLLRKMDINSTKGVGFYYDDPAKTQQDKLRSDVGNILEKVDDITLAKVNSKLDVKQIKKQKAVVVEIPIKSPLSYMIAPMKAYPAITKYWKEKGYKEDAKDSFGMEIYDIPGKVTYYVMYIPQ